MAQIPGNVITLYGVSIELQQIGVMMRHVKVTSASQPYPPQKTFLTNEQFCRLVGRSHHTSQRWRTQGEGPPFLKVGGRIMYDLEDDVLPWLEAQKRTNTAYDEQDTD